jgi:hypothetical protein
VTVSPDLASKLVAMISPGLASKLVASVSRFRPQNQQVRFGDLSLKMIATVSWFKPQNQAGYRWEDEDGAGHALRSNGLLHVKASRAMFSQSNIKTGGGTLRRLHEDEVEDG